MLIPPDVNNVADIEELGRRFLDSVAGVSRITDIDRRVQITEGHAQLIQTAHALGERASIRESIAHGRTQAKLQAALAALEQIAALAEFGTTGPDTRPRCKSRPLTRDQATQLRGSISELARDALKEARP